MLRSNLEGYKVTSMGDVYSNYISPDCFVDQVVHVGPSHKLITLAITSYHSPQLRDLHEQPEALVLGGRWGWGAVLLSLFLVRQGVESKE